MALMGRTIIESTGYVGEPGYNILHWTGGLGAGPNDPDGVEEFHDTLETALGTPTAWWPDGVILTIQPEVVYFESEDGILLGSTTDPGGARTWAGTGNGVSLSRAECLNVNLATADYVNGRRLQGRIFIGPVATDVFDGAGQISQTIVDDMPDLMSGLISGLGGRLAVWHRPTNDPPTNGAYGDVTTVTCRRTPGTLRSRKT